VLALEHNRRDAWAVHAVAHVLEMQGRIAEGVRWLEQREPDWSPENFFAVHNYWHLALFQLELGEHAPVLALYDAKVRGGGSEVIMGLLDASALLWRLQLVGVDVLDLTLLEAALRAGQLSLARGLTQSRLDKKPNSPAPLQMLARIYAAAGGSRLGSERGATGREARSV